MLSKVDNLSLDFLNRASLAWVEQEYNRAENEEMKAAPINEYIEVKDVSRPSPDEEKFKFSFTRPETRKQRKRMEQLSFKVFDLKFHRDSAIFINCTCVIRAGI